MPRHVVSYRPLEGEERDQLATPPLAKTDEWGCAASVLAAAAVLGCALGAALQVVFQALTRMRFLPLVTMGLLTFVAWRVAGAIRRTERERLQRQAQDRQEDAVEVWEVWDPIVAVEPGHEPTYVVDMGGGKLLVVRRDALSDVPVLSFGRPWPHPAAGAPDGDSPPLLSSHFVVHRGRRSGRILRVNVLGEPVAVSGTPPAGSSGANPPETSAVLDGTLEHHDTGGRSR